MNTRQEEIKDLGKLLHTLESTEVAEFNDWKWFKNFDNIEEATGFLLGHLKRTRELLKFGLVINKKLLEKLEDQSTQTNKGELLWKKQRKKDD
jgi:hypothetical protein|tara:strand:+ start:684 stop:962 length:279 start_codon:yes stop_codon:yes gene_type:complete